MYITIIEMLKNERIAITKKLLPVSELMASKRSELSRLQSAIAASNGLLDGAIQNASHVEGRALIGDATPAELADAKKARAAAQMAFAATQNAAAGVRVLEQELSGLQAAVHGLATRLANIDTEQADAEKNYLRSVVDSVCAEYSQAARDLTEKLSAVLAANQALAMSGGNPDLLTPAVWNFAVPALESSSARPANGGGWLFSIDDARSGQATALVELRQRIAADGIAIAGL